MSLSKRVINNLPVKCHNLLSRKFSNVLKINNNIVNIAFKFYNNSINTINDVNKKVLS